MKLGCRYGSKLNFEKELGLRLKGENGIMKKKFSALQKDIEDQREEIRTMFAQKKELYQVWSSCFGCTASSQIVHMFLVGIICR